VGEDPPEYGSKGSGESFSPCWPLNPRLPLAAVASRSLLSLPGAESPSNADDGSDDAANSLAAGDIAKSSATPKGRGKARNELRFLERLRRFVIDT
jgi:hypothetical protein